MVDDQLEIEVDKICEYQRKHDTLAFYKRMQLFCSECLLLINREYLKCDEIEIINQIRQIWASNNYDIEVIRKFHFTILEKTAVMTIKEMNTKRHAALGAIQSVATPFEAWEGNECYRADMLDFFIGDIYKVEVDIKVLYLKIKDYFSGILINCNSPITTQDNA